MKHQRWLNYLVWPFPIRLIFLFLNRKIYTVSDNREIPHGYAQKYILCSFFCFFSPVVWLFNVYLYLCKRVKFWWYMRKHTRTHVRTQILLKNLKKWSFFSHSLSLSLIFRLYNHCIALCRAIWYIFFLLHFVISLFVKFRNSKMQRASVTRVTTVIFDYQYEKINQQTGKKLNFRSIWFARPFMVCSFVICIR